MSLIFRMNGALGQQKIACVTDSELIGNVFEDEKAILDFTKEFYKGEEQSEQALEKLLTQSYMAIFSGKNAVAFGVRIGIVDSDAVIKVKGIPHAQCLIG